MSCTHLQQEKFGPLLFSLMMTETWTEPKIHLYRLVSEAEAYASKVPEILLTSALIIRNTVSNLDLVSGASSTWKTFAAPYSWRPRPKSEK